MADDPLSLEEGARTFDWGEKLHGYAYVAKLLLKRYWWIPLLGFSAGVAWQAWKVVQSRPSYVSEAKLMLSGFTVNPGTTAIQEQFGFWFGNQAFILSSGTVRAEAEKRVLAFNPELRPSWVAVEARQLPDTAIIRVIARGDDSRYTRAYLDALIDEFINFRQRMKGETSDRALLAITEKLETLDRQIKEQEDAVVEFRKRNNLMFIQEQGETAGSNLARLKTTQAELRTRLRLLQTLAQRPEVWAAIFSAPTSASSARMRRPALRRRAATSTTSAPSSRSSRSTSNRATPRSWPCAGRSNAPRRRSASCASRPGGRSPNGWCSWRRSSRTSNR